MINTMPDMNNEIHTEDSKKHLMSRFNQGDAFARMSALYAPTLKEEPADAEIPSHRLLLRGGFIRKTASGLYSYLPLGWRVLKKIETIIREEMDASGAQECLLPILGPSTLWEESGRISKYGPELMRLEDRHERTFVLGPTHEEIMTDLVRHGLRSYKELPLNLYQISTKFRDELRPRFGLMRGREFIMKDAYSFDADVDGMKESFKVMYNVYTSICERLNLKALPVAADAGQIGGADSIEFMALAESGEAAIASCSSCGYAADLEAATARVNVGDGPQSSAGIIEEVSTPGISTIADLARFVGVEEKDCKKAVALIKEGDSNENPQAIIAMLPGDHELNEVKAYNAFGPYHLMSDEELERYGLVKGFIGPHLLPPGMQIVADISLRDSKQWLIGANKADTHYRGAEPGRDFTVDAWFDLATVNKEDGCPVCGNPLSLTRGIEVGQIFQLADKYSAPLHATFLDKDGKEKALQMGCYGIGVTRTLAAIVEQHHDDDGIIWPITVAPYEVGIIALDPKHEEVRIAAETLATELSDAGLQVLLDDRDERPGVKFNEADLMGTPVQIVIGKRGVAENTVELKIRGTREKSSLSTQEAKNSILALVEELKNR